MTSNQIAFFKAKAEKEHYERMDSETARHNVSDESIKSTSNAITQWFNERQNEHMIRSDAINMAHYERQDAEQFRHNKVGESQQDIANNIAYLNALSKQEEASARTTSAEASMKSAEASERKASIEAYLSLDPYGREKASAEYSNIQAYYVPKYYGLSEAANISKINLEKAQTVKNYTSIIPDVIKGLSPLNILSNLGG